MYLPHVCHTSTDSTMKHFWPSLCVWHVIVCDDVSANYAIYVPWSDTCLYSKCGIPYQMAAPPQHPSPYTCQIAASSQHHSHHTCQHNGSFSVLVYSPCISRQLTMSTFLWHDVWLYTSSKVQSADECRLFYSSIFVLFRENLMNDPLHFCGGEVLGVRYVKTENTVDWEGTCMVWTICLTENSQFVCVDKAT